MNQLSLNLILAIGLFGLLFACNESEQVECGVVTNCTDANPNLNQSQSEMVGGIDDTTASMELGENDESANVESANVESANVESANVEMSPENMTSDTRPEETDTQPEETDTRPEETDTRPEEIDLSTPGEGVHAFSAINIYGEEVDFRAYRNKVLLIVNVASRCGYTGQYEGLQELYEQYQAEGFEILGFPANNFASQEPGSNEEIAEFCQSRYSVTFPMFGKISVKGDDIHPLYEYLTGESMQEVSWNFNKFLIDKNGQFVQHYQSGVTPMDEALNNEITRLLED